ncbi:hypothetical protein B0T17DRAFT_409005 [Bombardia bombarda]|uniref:Uncharacterized protein n=1 Tax=Bombardia bombarda TaxID=252184 RepID=A0AA39WBL3_9PEZI|nr:hypothetical protein B0T17DRAFT_409005 [Bombardia bombarda]
MNLNPPRPRMYKAQFSRWNWHKYSTTSSSRSSRSEQLAGSENPRKHDHCPYPRPTSALPGRKKGTSHFLKFPTRLLEPTSSFHLTTAMTAHRHLILGFADHDPRWQTATTTPFAKLGGSYDPIMISHFIGALKQLELGDFAHGGRLLRGAFLELESLLADGHIAAIWDCCVSVPQLALMHGGRRDILLTFLRYLARLATARAPGGSGHPVAVIAASTLALLGQMLPDDDKGLATQVGAYTQTVWRLWVDTMAGLLPGRENNICVLHTTRTYLLVQQAPADAPLAQRMVAGYDALARDAVGALGEHDAVALAVEFDALLTQFRFGMPGRGFDGRIDGLLGKLSSKPGNRHVAADRWESAEDRQILRGAWALGALFAQEVTGDDVRAAECRRQFLRAPAEGDWAQFALRMEEALRRKGRLAEAQEVRKRRGEVEIPSEIVEMLEREEMEMGVGMGVGMGMGMGMAGVGMAGVGMAGVGESAWTGSDEAAGPSPSLCKQF